jgi:hypothetical protein
MINSRKFRVWLISLGAVLLVYLLYSLLSTTPRIEIDTGSELPDTVTDANVSRLDGEVGKIGDIGVGSVRKAEYIHLNQQKQVDRVLGFEELLHKAGNEWEVKKPYMNIFRRDLGCYINADRGEVRVETVAGRPSPKDARFTGNVVAHILPENSSDVKEGFLYLDDVTFIGDKSQFLTTGPVKYVSPDVRMLGNGLQFIYNERLERIELLRILHLDSVRLKISQTAFFPTLTEQARRPADANASIQTREPNKIVAPVHSQKVKSSPIAGTQATSQKEAERYRCVFSKNVVIDSPEQLIFAGEKLSIRDIFRPKDSGRQSDKADPCSTDTIIEPVSDSASSVQKGLEPNTAASPNSPVIAEQIPFDIVVTCDNGFVITPMDSPQSDTNSVQFSIEDLVSTAAEKLTQLKKTDGRTVFIAQKIDYSASTGDTVAEGPSELTFYTGDLIRPEANETVVPVTITAQRKAQFLPASNQAVFVGDCVCTMLREDANSRQKYALSAPHITADLSRNKDKHPSASAAAIEHLTAGGGAVQLDTSKWAGEDLLGFTKLKCRRFDYDAKQQSFLATGPGIIAIDNSKISEPNAVAGRFSLRRRCYAVVENFETLKYLLETNQIIAEAEGQGVVVDYFPIVDGKYGQRVMVTAGRVVADLLETADGRTEISTLRATGGITYEEKDKEFAGSRLFYDATKAVLTVQGDQSHPCIYNGTLVDQIEYDLKTDTVKFKIVGPGVIQGKR